VIQSADVVLRALFFIWSAYYVQNVLEADSTSVLDKLGKDRKYVLRMARKAMFISFYEPVFLSSDFYPDWEIGANSSIDMIEV
jgi:hypothetical protein